MHVNRRAMLRPSPGRTRVIEMNVAQKDMPDVADAETNAPKFGGDIFEGRFRAGVEEDQSFAALHGGHGDDSRATELTCIENVNHRAQVLTETAAVKKVEFENSRTMPRGDYRRKTWIRLATSSFAGCTAARRVTYQMTSVRSSLLPAAKMATGDQRFPLRDGSADLCRSRRSRSLAY